MILSLQIDKMSPKITKNFKNQKIKVDTAINNLGKNKTFLDLLRTVAIDCDDFVMHMNSKVLSRNTQNKNRKCGDLFNQQPIFSPIGTCFTTKEQNCRLKTEFYS